MRHHKGVDPAKSQIPEELEGALKRLLEVCDQEGKSFPRMRQYADRIMNGRCSAVESVSIVIRLLEPRSEGPMSIEDCRQHLLEEADELEAELEKIAGREAELKDRIAKARKGADALERVQNGKPSAANAGVSHRKEPCPWPGCDQPIAPQGRRTHIDKHERDAGMTLEAAQREAGVTPISA